MQVAVENFGGAELDYEKLGGKWLLIYTTAQDVVSARPCFISSATSASSCGAALAHINMLSRLMA